MLQGCNRLILEHSPLAVSFCVKIWVNEMADKDPCTACLPTCGWFLRQENISAPWILQESHIQTRNILSKKSRKIPFGISHPTRLIGEIPSASSLSCFHYTCFCWLHQLQYEKKKVPYNGKEISPYNWVILKFPTVNIYIYHGPHLTP